MGMSWEQIRQRGKRVGGDFDPETKFISWQKIGKNNMVRGVWTGDLKYHSSNTDKKSPYVILDKNTVSFQKDVDWDKPEKEQKQFDEAKFIGITLRDFQVEQMEAGREYCFDFVSRNPNRNGVGTWNKIEVIDPNATDDDTVPNKPDAGDIPF